MDVSGSLAPQTSTLTKDQARIEQLRDASEKLEAGFLAEMLKASGLGKTPDTFGGGTGEDQFTSFLVQAQAEKLVEAGGIGLAEHIFQALVEKE
ncbi:rod-binding protein [Celeribacter sp.]|uniref:rod-binding protein n=1 Tax=Celeribacter sp. TaxID=1890673 RepID=UPI003A929E38